MKLTADHVKWLLLGVLALLVVKYGIVGLSAWDATFHPGRTEDAATLARFGKPFLGLAS